MKKVRKCKQCGITMDYIDNMCASCYFGIDVDIYSWVDWETPKKSVQCVNPRAKEQTSVDLYHHTN